MGRSYTHFLKNYDHFVVELAVLSSIYELELVLVKMDFISSQMPYEPHLSVCNSSPELLNFSLIKRWRWGGGARMAA